MNIKKIIETINLNSNLIVINKRNNEAVTQFIGSGRILFRIEGMPYLTHENILNILGRDKEQDVLDTLPPSWDVMSDVAENEEHELTLPHITIGIAGREYYIFEANDKIRFVNAKLLKKAASAFQSIRLLYREEEGEGYLIGAEGMLFRFLIKCCPLGAHATKEQIEMIQDMAVQMEENFREAEEKRNG